MQFIIAFLFSRNSRAFNILPAKYGAPTPTTCHHCHRVEVRYIEPTRRHPRVSAPCLPLTLPHPPDSQSPRVVVMSDAGRFASITVSTFTDQLRLMGSRDDIRKLLAQETEKHRQTIHESLSAITKLHTVHNSLAPLNSLPAELLGLIFSHLVSPGDLRSKPSNFLGYTPQPHSQGSFLVDPPRGNKHIVRVTHVCKYWRAVGIQNPWLWTSFPLHHTDAVKVYLARSKNLPISLSLTRRLSINLAPTLSPSTHRIRSIHIETTLADDIELLWAELRLSAPNLKELFIEHLKCNSHGNGYAVGQLVRLPTLFNGEVPSLRILTLRGVPSPFELFPATISHLDIGRVQSPLPPLAELLKMLTNCPLLETLNICGAWEWEDIFDHALQRNSVALLSLARIYLQLEPQEVHGIFLASLSLPQHTDVFVVCAIEEHGDFRDALSTITPRFVPPCFQSFRRLHLFREGMNARLQAFRAVDTISDRPALDIDCLDPWAQPDPDWAGFHYDWPFDASQIQTLVVVYKPADCLPVEGGGPGVRDGTKFDEWGNTFWQLPDLNTLRVMGLPKLELEELFDALAMWGYPNPVCPGLTTVEVYDTDGMSAAWDRLVDVAERRVPRGMRESTLKQVELFSCNPRDLRNLELLISELGIMLVVDEEIVVVSAPGTPSRGGSDEPEDLWWS